MSKIGLNKLFWNQHLWRIKSILIHEYQHESTRINTGQHESDTSQHKSTRVRHESNTSQHKSDTSQQESTRVWHKSTRINTSPTRLNTTPTRVNTKQHQFKTDHEKETNIVRRKDKTWLNGGVEDCIYQDLGFLLKFMTNWTIKNYFFCKGIYFIKRCVIIYLIFFPRKI